MQDEEGQHIEDASGGTPATLSFWQRTGPRVVALIALVGPAAAVFLTQHGPSRPELIQDLKKTQPTPGLCDRNDESRANGNSARARGKSARSGNKSRRIDADYSRHNRKSTAVGHRPTSGFAINDQTSGRDVRGLSRDYRE